MLEKLGKLWTQVQDNVMYVLVFLLIAAAIFAVATALEKLWLKPEKQSPARRTAYIGIFAAIAAVLVYFEFPLPFAPAFYELDFSFVPELICSFSLGPVAGVVCALVKELLKLLLRGTTTAFVGDLSNFVNGCAFILPASVVYHVKKSRRSAVIGMGVGTVVLTVFGSIFNAVYLIPAFAALFGWPIEKIVGMGTAINPAIVSVNTLVLFAVVPFNLLKGVAVSIITFLLYKHIERLLRMR
ncbi:MAG: ECF transporter S component [Oscillospiraceae bacterium]|nr:ECF transporter S component [Oscillospiraceae bacterium]